MTCEPSIVASVPATIVHIHSPYPVKQSVLAVWQADRSRVSHVDLCAAQHYTECTCTSLVARSLMKRLQGCPRVVPMSAALLACH
jgi:hypothetical protein